MPAGKSSKRPSDARLTLQTMGVLRLVSIAADGTETLVLEGGKPLALLAYLVSAPARSARRDQLIDLLWADMEPDAAKHALRQTLWYLKKRTGESVVESSGDVLSVGGAVTVDRDHLLAAAAKSDHDTVVATYAGDFLPGFAAPGGAEFEGWADVERRRLRGIYQRATESSVRALLQRGHAREAIQRALRARDIDRTQQSTWRLLLEALVAGREWGQAQLEADAFERAMHVEELPLEPASRSALRLARQGADDAPAEDRERHAFTAELVGREREFAALLDGVSQAQRGRGDHWHLRAGAGLGKTRLLDDLQARLRAKRVRAVVVRGEMGARELPYAAASALALALGTLPGARGVSPDSASALLAMAPALSTYFSVSVDRSGGREALRRRSLALAELAGVVCDEQGIVVLVDDVHWMDAESRTVLAHLASRARGLPLLLVSAGRPIPEGRLDDPEARILDLAPLTEGQCAELLASIASMEQAAWGGRFVHELWRSSGGAPLLVLETLQLLRDRELLQVADGEWVASAPHALSALLLEGGALSRRVGALPREQGWLLLLLAIAGQAMSDGELLESTGAPPSGLDDARRELERRGLISRVDGRWAIAHDELALAVLEASTAERVRAAHAALGRTLWRDSTAELAPMRRAAQHLVQGGEEAQLHSLFGRFVRRSRGLGDDRPLPALADDLLGRHARGEVVRQLVRALPWHVRAGLTSGRRIAVAAALLLAVAAVPTTAFVVSRSVPRRAQPVAELVIAAVDGSEGRMRRLPIIAAEWAPGRPMPVLAPNEPLRADPFASWPAIEVPGRPGVWLASRSVADSGVIDLFLLEGTTERRLTFSRGDDLLTTVSPDGRWAVIATARWNAESHYDLARVDLTTLEVVQLTGGEETDHHARWNHAGDRIAFLRQSWVDETSGICVMNPDGSDVQCPGAWRDLGQPIGWIDDRRLLVLGVARASTPELLVADLGDGRVTPLGERISMRLPALSPDGRWLACLCERIGYAPGTWFVMPLGRPADARVLGGGGEGEAWQVAFSNVGRPAPLHSLTIDHGPTQPIVGVPHLLTAHAMRDGIRTTPLAQVRWSSLDTQRVVVDSLTGVATARRGGRARVRAVLPGWGDVVAELQLRDAAEATARDAEEWTDGWDARWWSFGTPRPEVRSRDGERYLALNGDGSFASGVIGVAPVDGTDGVAVEARVSMRQTRLQWQVVRVKLRSAIDLVTISDSLRVSGTAGGTQQALTACGTAIPAGEGRRAAGKMLSSLGDQVGETPIPAAVRDGAWAVLRVQLFPDGRCGVALDGMPIFISRGRMEAGGPLQVQVDGNDVGTEARIGAVRVWRGVPSGVAWERWSGGD